MSERIKKIGSVIFYIAAAIGIIDMMVFSTSNGQVRMIQSLLGYVFGEAK